MRAASVCLFAWLGIALLGCGSSAPDVGTAVRVVLTYDDSLALDGAEVTLDTQLKTIDTISHELLLLVPDTLAERTVPLEVWGDKDQQRAVFASAEVTPRLGKTVEVSLALGGCEPSCNDDVLTSCAAPPGKCPQGCTTDGGAAHCVGPTPSNGVPATFAGGLTGTITISASSTFNTDTGEISGGLSRDPGAGVDPTGIAFYARPAMDIVGTGVSLGVFAFNNLAVSAGATVTFTGTSAPVFLIAGTASIDGTIDVQGNHATPGIGGFRGGDGTVPAEGCGPGLPGTHQEPLDSGASGGAAGSEGGLGDTAGAVAGAAAPAPCLPATLEPLQGGSGGGAGAPGRAISAVGGGGGGAIQISSLGMLTITGKVIASGGGGSTPAMTSNDYGSGAGGGAGGAILLEAPMVNITGILVANGGGGGGGGGGGASSPGDNGGTTLVAAPAGGTGGAGNNDGGAGGGQGPPDGGKNVATDGGGGGGGQGLIVIRGNEATRSFIPGNTSPGAKQLPLHP